MQISNIIAGGRIGVSGAGEKLFSLKPLYLYDTENQKYI